MILCAVARAGELPDVDAFLAAEFTVPMERVEKWTRSARSHDDNQKLATEFAEQFAKTGDERYARAALKIFLAYAENYSELRRRNHNASNGGALHAQLLDEARWLVRMAEAYHMLLKRGAVSEEQQQVIAKGLLEPAVEVEMQGNMPNNHQWWFNAAMGVTGFVLGNEDYIRTAIDGERGFIFHIANHINDDGLIFEQAMTYQHFSMAAYMHLASMAEKHGVDLWHLEVDDATEWDGLNGKKSFKIMFDAYPQFAFPDGSMAAVKDSGPEGRTFVQPFYLELADKYRKYYDDPWHQKLLDHYTEAQRRRDRGEPPAPALNHGDAPFALTGRNVLGSTLYPSSGLAVLRGDPEDVNAPAVTMTFGPYGGGHGHPDKLSITMYANGEIVLPDIGRYEYGDPLHQTWANQTLAHNTVAVDERSHKPMHVPGMSIWAEAPAGDTGVLREFVITPHVKLLRADCDTAVDGVTLDRTVVLLGGVLVDVFEASGNRKHLFDWALHVNGTLQTTSIGLAPSDKKVGKYFGYQHLENIRGAKRSGPWTTTWRTPGGNGLLVSALGQGERILVADTPGNPPDTTLPTMLLRHRGDTARFVTVMAPFAAGQDPNAILVSAAARVTYEQETDAPAPVAVMFAHNRADHTLVLAPGGVVYNLNDIIRTDARMLAVSVSRPEAGPPGETTTMAGVSRVNDVGGQGLSTALPLRVLTVGYEAHNLRLEAESEQANTLTLGEDMLFSIRSQCYNVGLRLNGREAALTEPLVLDLPPGKTVLELVCNR